jgi:hypothetical protein
MTQVLLHNKKGAQSPAENKGKAKKKKNCASREKEMAKEVEKVHSYNPSYLGGRDQEEHSWRPAWAKRK